MSSQPQPPGPPSRRDARATSPPYEPPTLVKYGSLAALTRSGVGSKMEGGGPNTRFG